MSPHDRFVCVSVCAWVSLRRVRLCVEMGLLCVEMGLLRPFCLSCVDFAVPLCEH